MTRLDPAPPAEIPPPPARCLRELGLAWESLGEREVGTGALAWLRISPGGRVVRTLGRPGSASERALRIGETGQVPEIHVENRSQEPWLLPAHLVLCGGWQTRAVERSVVLPASGSARVPVKCVEAGRWAPREGQEGSGFAIADRTSVRTRWSTSRSMAQALSGGGRFAAAQDAVWEQVDQELAKSPIASRTRSYEAYLRGVKQPCLEAARRAGVRPPPDANAVALFPREGGFWIEAYPTPDALADHADDLVADLFDASPPPDGKHTSTLPPVKLEPLLDALWEAELHALDRIEGTLGEARALTGGGGPITGVAGALLLVDGALAHLAVGAPPRPAPDLAPAASEPVEPRKAAAPVRVEAGVSPARPQIDLAAMRATEARIRGMFPDVIVPRDRAEGYRLVRILDRSVAWIDVRTTGDGYGVLGTHDRCDLVLGNEGGLWLRHLVATCVPLADGLGLRLLDLKTDVPFFVGDDVPQWSVTVDGPFAVRLGRHVVCGFPIGPAAGAGGPSETTLDPLPDRPTAIRADSGTIEVDVSPPSRRVRLETSLVFSAPVSQLEDLVGTRADAEHARITLERSGMGASVEIPLEALDAGVLLGRALNCFDGGLRRILCEAISRAHVLLLRDSSGVYALDLCSTNGTRLGGKRIRRLRLPDAGTTLELGKKVGCRWHRREAG